MYCILYHNDKSIYTNNVTSRYMKHKPQPHKTNVSCSELYINKMFDY